MRLLTLERRMRAVLGEELNFGDVTDICMSSPCEYSF